MQQYYPSSSGKYTRLIELVLEKVKLLQVTEYSRLVKEYPEKNDDELLPVYLGRLGQKMPFRMTPRTDETAEGDAEYQEEDSTPSQTVAETLSRNGFSDLVLDQGVA